MFFQKSKRSYNEELAKYTKLLSKIQTILIKDEDLLTLSETDISTIDLDIAGKIERRPNRRIAFKVPFKKPSLKRRLKTEIALLEEEISSYRGGQYDQDELSLFGEIKSLTKAFSEIFTERSSSQTIDELIERIKELKIEKRAILEYVFENLSRQQNYLQKERSLYNLLIDQRKGLRRVVRNIINSSLDEEEDAYLINISVLSHLKIKLNKNFFNITSNEFQNKNYRCYTAYT